MDATKPYNMLIIDPQNDFHEGGSLAVPGAKADSARIAKFITNSSDKINKIFVSLDTHTPNHIGHPGYWRTMDSTDENPVEPGAWTIFSVNGDNIVGTVYNPITQEVISKNNYTPKRNKFETTVEQYNKRVAFTKMYIETVPTLGGGLKGPALIWPTHCIEGSPGHAVNENLKRALDIFNGGIGSTDGRVEYHIKGQNELVEMYSIFQAEIPMETFDNVTSDNMNLYYSGDKDLKTSSKINQRDTDREDGAYLQTSFNEELFKSLTEDGNPIVICGEALSHCVNWSLRDLIANILKKNTTNYANGNNKLVPGQVILLANCSSPVTGFVTNVDALMKFCNEAGVTIKYVDNGQIVDVKPVPTQGGTRKRRRHKNRRTKSKPKRSKKTHNRKSRHRRRTRK
jgi:nicotinamidase/pyrazinamidase